MDISINLPPISGHLGPPLCPILSVYKQYVLLYSVRMLIDFELSAVQMAIWKSQLYFILK